jgi:glycerol-3-phosphate acyltransferase PlsX
LTDSRRVRVAVDAMGGDQGPQVIVEGAVEAARRATGTLGIVLVGDEPEIRRYLPSSPSGNLSIEVVHTSETISMAESATSVYRRRKDASVVVASKLLAERRVDALVSAGNTGAVVTSSLLVLGRLKGVLRPAIATLVPTPTGHTVLLDVGANSDTKPIHLFQFAVMGRVYAQYVFDVPSPKVGLLNIGEESSKGSEVAQQAFKILDDSREPLNFIGNVEGRDILRGTANVVVCDGFTGNVILKFAESVVWMAVETTRREMATNLKFKAGALLLRPLLHRLRNKLNYEEYGGAPLLGVNGVVVICHGRSSAKAITNAIRVAQKSAVQGIDLKIREELAREQRGEEAIG